MTKRIHMKKAYVIDVEHGTGKSVLEPLHSYSLPDDLADEIVGSGSGYEANFYNDLPLNEEEKPEPAKRAEAAKTVAPPETKGVPKK